MKNPATHPSRSLPLLAILGVAFASSGAFGASSSTGEEYLAVAEAVEPNVLFLIDLSSVMGDPCPVSSWYGGSVDTGTDETGVEDTGGVTVPSSSSTDPCIDEVTSAIDQITQHFDWARFGVAGTASSSSTDSFFEIAPLGSTHSEVSAALATVTNWSVDTRNLAESAATLASDYFSNSTTDDGIDDDELGIGEFGCDLFHGRGEGF